MGILVQVQNSGPGIKPEAANHIFEPFFTTKAKGIGMGLSISYSIIESHGGQLSLESASQGGAVPVYFAREWRWCLMSEPGLHRFRCR